MNNYEEAVPNPEFLIKSIAEQGYSLQTALADLIDNSISAEADKVEILADTNKKPYTLFIADNGNGMDVATLKESMTLPSESLEKKRVPSDLGRFGLGMKTASFSQTRKFTVLSRKKNKKSFSACTWDVNYLRKSNSWRLIINSDYEIDALLTNYNNLRLDFLNGLDDFKVNTLIVWQGLYKYEQNRNSTECALKRELTEKTTDYLSLVFHRFLEKKETLQIRINNKQLVPFNPFPSDQTDLRAIEYKKKPFENDCIEIEGFVLPARSIEEAKKGNSIWTTRYKGLMDMEGIYIYRADRIIICGGWNGLIRKSPRLQLARLRVDVGNRVDDLLQLNVAKSRIIVPHDLKKGFENYINELKIEAEREYYNRGIRKHSKKRKGNKSTLFERNVSNKGVLLELNSEYPLIESLQEGLSREKVSQLRLLFRMINTTLNKIRKVHKDQSLIKIETEGEFLREDFLLTMKQLVKNGINKEVIRNEILPVLGVVPDSISDEIWESLNGE